MDFRITYRPFEQSSLTADDLVLRAHDAEDAEREFTERHPLWVFLKAEPTLL